MRTLRTAVGAIFRLTLVLTGLVVAQSDCQAAAIEQLGSGAPGIDAMWGELKGIFPHTDIGSGGLAFVVLMMTNFILRFIGGVAVLMIVYAGIRMIMSVADENAHTEAKKIVMFASIGLILAIGADAIVLYVMNVVRMAVGG